MRFETNIYNEAWRVLRLCPVYVAMAVVGEFLIAIFKQNTDTGPGTTLVASVLVWSFLAYAAHAEVLYGTGRDKTQDGNRVFGFALRTFRLGLIALLPAIGLVILTAPHLQNARNPDATQIALVLFLLPVFGVTSLLVLSFAGTLLPAFVADKGRGLGAALARGWRQLFWVAGRLLAGPGPIFLLAFVVQFLPVLMLAPEDTLLLSPSYVPNPIAIGSILSGIAMQAYGTVMVAVVLSRAFLRDTAMRGEAAAPAA